MSKELCFGCLCAGHRSQDCDKRLTCRVCSQTHPSGLHIDKKDRANTNTKYSKEPVCNITASHKTCGHTGAGDDRCILSILPVQVKSIKGDRIINTYAFLILAVQPPFVQNILCKGSILLVGEPIFSYKLWDRKGLNQNQNQNVFIVIIPRYNEIRKQSPNQCSVDSVEK